MMLQNTILSLDGVGSRLAEILPMSLDEKQVILEIEDYLVRLYRIKDFIDSKKICSQATSFFLIFL